MKNLYIQEKGGGFSWDGENWEYSWLRLFNYETPGMENVCRVLGRFADHHHCQIALDAGGKVVSETSNDYGGVDQTVAVSIKSLQRYAALLFQQRDPNEGMMQTSTGFWVLIDDWDKIESAM